MTHPLVEQLRFARSEFRKGVDGLTDEEARRRFGPMNCLSWSIAHMASQEQRYWLGLGQNRFLLPEIHKLYAYGAPAQTPSLDEALEAWHAITRECDPWLDEVTPAKLLEEVRPGVSYGNLLLRATYHYWYHTGENEAIRQLLGHADRPTYVGDIDGEAPYRPHPVAP